MDYQQQRYIRPPLQPPPPRPSLIDQHHYQQPPPPSQAQPPWFPGQFQYHSPSQHHHWPPPPQSDHLQPPPYPTPPIHTHQYPPPRPHLHSLLHQSHPHLSQEWGNPNWSHSQGWENPAYNHEEDLVARARAWAANNAAKDNQSQFTPPVAGRTEEQQGHYNSHYPPQNVDPRYTDVQQSPTISSSNYQPYSTLVGSAPHGVPVSAHPQDSTTFTSGYLPPHDRNFAGDANTSFHHHRESSSTSLSSVHQQEVPSSYSSVAGTEEATNQSEKLYNSMALPPQQQYTSHYSFDNKQSGEVASDVGDQPLDFAPRYSQDPHMKPPNFTQAWPPPLYPQLVDHSSSVSISAPMFGRMTGTGFQSAVPSVTAPFGVGSTAHPPNVFPIDAYGVSERPKKGSVPNWLREEIIKNKPVLTSSAPDLSDEETVSFKDEGVDDKFSVKGDLPANSRSADSSKSTEDEDDDDENDVEAARTAAINQEIKRILTEVLLKVTDELFDEIATKVLSEHYDLTVEVKQNGTASSHMVSASNLSHQTSEVPNPKISHSDDVFEKSTSSTPGDVLGLGTYASDEDEDEEIQRSDASKSEGSNVYLNLNKISVGTQVDKDGSKVATEENHGETHIGAESKHGAGSLNKAEVIRNAVVADENVLPVSDALKSKSKIGDKISAKSISDDSQSKETRNKRDKNDNAEKISSAVKSDDHRKKQDERHARKEKANNQNGSVQRKREVESVIKAGEKLKDLDSRNRSSHAESKEDRKEIERERRSSSAKDGNDRKRERRTKDEKNERSRNRYGTDTSKHKRRRSSDSSDTSSDESRRKVSSEKRKSSPSPVRSRRRQVSRSPHSKHSQRRHSPYSSLETTRGRKSRSRSPVRRQR